MHIGFQSKTLFSTPHLAGFFPDDTLHLRRRYWPHTAGLDALAGWGHKRPGMATRRLAQRRCLPYLALEDGFLRSYDLAVRGAAPWSIVIDDQGIYYDATGPSRLEALIAGTPDHADSAALLSAFLANRLSKYNNGAEPALASLGIHGRYVILADQCMGDASVPLGMASAESFQQMLDDARQRHPGCQLVVKTHPDVISGKRRGYLDAYQLPEGSLLLGAEINPHVLFSQAEAVHSVTSLLGFEALLAGKETICHGAPFYAGWGLTHDTALPASVAARRSARPSALQLFTAAYREYARYIDPFNGAPATLADTIERMGHLRHYYRAWPRTMHAAGFSPWKRTHVTPFLVPPGGAVTFHPALDEAVAAAQADGTPLAIWAAREPEAWSPPVPVIRVEDGFLRSRGLGSNLIAANSLVRDTEGIYFDATRPSQLEQWLEHGECASALRARAAALSTQIVQARASKYNLPPSPLPPLPTDHPVHLVVGQVEDDASIRQGATTIRTNDALLCAVRARHPKAFLIYKPHPDVIAGNRRAGLADRQADTLADYVWREGNIISLFPHIARLHTITSLAGFEALLRGIPVTTYGHPFYAGWGLTDDAAGPHPRRTRRLDLDTLVAGALIYYPLYYDWQARLPGTPEKLIAQLETMPYTSPNQRHRFWRWLTGYMRRAK